MTTDAVTIISGGLDSCTLTQHLHNDNKKVLALSFDYGQKHKKELAFAASFCRTRNIEHHIMDLTSLNPLISSSALTSDAEVPEGHYAEENMKQTVVPNRNMMMVSIAAAVAVSRKALIVATGVHAGDHYVYPDCRPEFLKAVQSTIRLANEGLGVDYMEVYAPFQTMTKTQIAQYAFNIGVRFNETWSCYKGGEIHCGRCGTCVERLEAIYNSGYSMYDETEYEDSEYWKSVAQNFSNEGQ